MLEEGMYDVIYVGWWELDEWNARTDRPDQVERVYLSDPIAYANSMYECGIMCMIYPS
jgi:hypothetical protein